MRTNGKFSCEINEIVVRTHLWRLCDFAELKSESLLFAVSPEPEFLNLRIPGIDSTESIPSKNQFRRGIDTRRGVEGGQIDSSFKN
jgi:hypothetical protein